MYRLPVFCKLQFPTVSFLALLCKNGNEPTVSVKGWVNLANYKEFLNKEPVLEFFSNIPGVTEKNHKS
jgi:hypothetical protein